MSDLPNFFEVDGVLTERVALTRTQNELTRAMSTAALLAKINGPISGGAPGPLALELLVLMSIEYGFDGDVIRFLEDNANLEREDIAIAIPEKHEHRIYDLYHFIQILIADNFTSQVAWMTLSHIADTFSISKDVLADLISSANAGQKHHIVVNKYRQGESMDLKQKFYDVVAPEKEWSQDLGSNLLELAQFDDPASTAAQAFLFRYMMLKAPDELLTKGLNLDKDARKWFAESKEFACGVERIVLSNNRVLAHQEKQLRGVSTLIGSETELSHDLKSTSEGIFYGSSIASQLMNPKFSEFTTVMAAGMQIQTYLNGNLREKLAQLDDLLNKANLLVDDPLDSKICFCNQTCNSSVWWQLVQAGYCGRPSGMRNQLIGFGLLLNLIRNENQIEQEIHLYDSNGRIGSIEAYSTFTVEEAEWSDGASAMTAGVNEVFSFSDSTISTHSTNPFVISVEETDGIACIIADPPSDEVTKFREWMLYSEHSEGAPNE
jgi:hypothetical protein